MVSQLLAERTPTDARILVLGAGGGQEILALANAHSGWSFDGVDPSSKMLELARETVEPHASRVNLHEGYISDVPQGPFDAATSILIFHFIPLEQRLETLTQIRQRLNKGAPFILVHLSFPQTEPERSLWIARHVTFGQSPNADPAKAETARQAIADQLTIISPEDEEKMLQQAGFSNASLFYAGMSIKGWIAYAD
ncbi:MAG: class I SAM-dependent methyltransferase [Alphaproteobacteria bacterium]|nr:class I SAM-dependent methyltransferase [Alphaproteobacteria bacterium]